jgi:dTDP-4-dehydrorhamnose 3,5-epimerase
MKFTPLELEGLILVEADVHRDDRGFFLESYHAAKFAEHGISATFVQDNHSRSGRHTLRGLHAQTRHPQAKLVRVVAGEIWDVVVDIRRGSPTFGKWCGAILGESNKHQLWVPPNFAHGFVVLSEQALFSYKCTQLYKPEAEHVIAWNDPDIGIDWRFEGTPSLSARDQGGVRLRDVPEQKLPVY